MKWLLGLSALCAVVIAFSLNGSTSGSFAQSGTPEASPNASPAASPVASPIASPSATVETSNDDLEALIFDLQATVSAQSDEITALQTQVANLEAAPTEPPATDEVESQDLTVIVLLRARADEIDGIELGEECAGSGRFRDLGPDTEVTIADDDGVVLSEGSLDSSELVFSGTLFRECQLTYVLPDVPAADDYTLAIGDRAETVLTSADLDAVDWTIEVSYGP